MNAKDKAPQGKVARRQIRAPIANAISGHTSDAKGDNK